VGQRETEIPTFNGSFSGETQHGEIECCSAQRLPMGSFGINLPNDRIGRKGVLCFKVVVRTGNVFQLWGDFTRRLRLLRHYDTGGMQVAP
jgi:hypothetical protein